jgi:hypothetical protein
MESRIIHIVSTDLNQFSIQADQTPDEYKAKVERRMDAGTMQTRRRQDTKRIDNEWSARSG